ncbi:polysaccharide deacetylase family protein [Mucilaginibacter sp. RS28]|uniref:Polysaccharide deacetylase family protein n=1 Tax=Mucilaginibacter straminoryzae TaxID=2932774 RepID=A0A9X1X795_9SPHI|nr:polysaccharide deacetylase family protein [Mucilaginibacter straminoryzae]MCJ8211450.1 polysaccharide deacetylase family protein [Mucilaginibacter straminoryzae]
MKTFLKKAVPLVITALAITTCLFAQPRGLWNNKQCAVVLTYDDAIDVDLDNVVPALDSVKLKGTFYLIGSSPVVNKRMAEWRKAAKEVHELGNHALFHPCDATLPGRDFAKGEHDLSKYSVEREVSEIRMNNVLLKAIDGKEQRTFAYPCGDLKIGDVFFYDQLKNDFIGARGVMPGMPRIDEVDLTNINAYAINGQDAAYMIGLVTKAMETHTLLVFLFHGVGGGHSLNVDLKAHSQLLHYLKDHQKEIWVAPMAEVAAFIKTNRKN